MTSSTNHNRRLVRNHKSPEEDTFGSECDYNSDVFKEQPSMDFAEDCDQENEITSYAKE